jgi:hypothetical protein
MKKKSVHLIVDLRDAREVEKLRARVRDLEQQNAQLKAFANRCEFNLVCQQKINLQLADYCQAAGYRIPKRLFTLWPGE